MKIKDTLMIAVAALAFMVITGVAKSDEKTITPKEFVSTVAEVPSKIGIWFTGEVEKTKEYQKKSWTQTKQDFSNLVKAKGKPPGSKEQIAIDQVNALIERQIILQIGEEGDALIQFMGSLVDQNLADQLKKIKADIDNLEAREEILLEKLEEAIEELEESFED